jgi:hypothetical protein
MERPNVKINLSSQDDNAARITSRKMYHIIIKLNQANIKPVLFGLPFTSMFANFFDGIPVSKTLDMGILELGMDLFNDKQDIIKQILQDYKADIVQTKEYLVKNKKPAMRILLDLKRISS